jgi:hypothetical protein
MCPLAEVELGGTEELGVGLGHEDACHPQGFLLGLLANEGRQALGFRFLFRGEKKVSHESLRVQGEDGFSKPVGIRFYATNYPPTLQLPTREIIKDGK